MTITTQYHGQIQIGDRGPDSSPGKSHVTIGLLRNFGMDPSREAICMALCEFKKSIYCQTLRVQIGNVLACLQESSGFYLH